MELGVEGFGCWERTASEGGPNGGDMKDTVGRREFIGGAAAVGGVMFMPAGRVWGTEANSQVRVGLAGMRRARDGGRYEPCGYGRSARGGAGGYVSGPARYGACGV